MTRAVPESAAAYGADYYSSTAQDADRPALWMYERMAKRLADRGSRVLEFGSGTGYFSRRLARHFESHAWDVSDYARTRTAAVSPTTTVVADAADVVPGTYALVVSLHVLEHVPDPSAALRQIGGWVRPGGRLLVVVPNPDGWGRRLKGAEWFGFRDPTHCSLLRQADWLAAIRDAGFDELAARSDGLWDAPYVRRMPTLVQKPLFGWGAAMSVVAGRAVMPATWGECLVVTARRRP